VPPIGLGEIHAFEIDGFVAVIFFLISFPLTRLAAYLEKRLIV
jgi:ABC-type amino acid transport system permease subunit